MTGKHNIQLKDNVYQIVSLRWELTCMHYVQLKKVKQVDNIKKNNILLIKIFAVFLFKIRRHISFCVTSVSYKVYSCL